MLSGRTCSPSSLKARCFIAAHDADTGNELWRTYTAAGADDPGGETWGDLPTARRVHVSPWGVPGSYDPELDLIYWGVAVPLPYPRIVRRGTWDVGDRTPCELYSNSTLALAADTGAITWYYQHLPCDDWDQDFVQDRTLIDTVVNPDPDAVMWINPKLAGTAEERKIVVTMGEPGGLFVNDRETGEFLVGVAAALYQHGAVCDSGYRRGDRRGLYQHGSGGEGARPTVCDLWAQRQGLVVVVVQSGDGAALYSVQSILLGSDGERTDDLGREPEVFDSRTRVRGKTVI